MSAHRIEVDDLIAQRSFASLLDFPSDRPVAVGIAGDRPSGFRGRGMDFEEHRVYQPGDEARTIDWRVSARTGVPHVRLYREERERQILLAVDVRAPMHFGTRRCFKAVHAARSAALLAWSAMQKRERIGGLCFGRACDEVRPAGGARGVLRLIHVLANAGAAAPGTGDLADALRRLVHLSRSGGIVALLSDFRGVGPREADLLAQLAGRCDVIAGFVSDPIETGPPAHGLYPVVVPDGSEAMLLDARSAGARKKWHDAFLARRAAVRQALRGAGVHHVELSTETPAHETLGAFFGARRRAA